MRKDVVWCLKCGKMHVPHPYNDRRYRGIIYALKLPSGLPSSEVVCECGKTVRLEMRFVTLSVARAEGLL